MLTQDWALAPYLIPILSMFPNGTNTFIGIMLAAAPLVLSAFGYTPTPAFNEQLPNALSAIVTIAGLVYATYGKLRSQSPGWFAKS